MPSTNLPKSLKLKAGMRNALLSAGLCVGLIVAYSMMIGQTPIPADLHISYDARACIGRCPIRHIDLTADGVVTITTPTGTRRSRISPFEVRRVLQAFTAVHFLDRDIGAYHGGGATGTCQLSLTAEHRKTAIRHSCGDAAPEIARPLAALVRGAILPAK